MGAQTASLHGHELAYVDSGAGPTILFIHGLLGSNRNWSHLCRRSWRRAIGWSCPTSSATGPPTSRLGTTRSALTPRRSATCWTGSVSTTVTLVGHSLGGGIALQFCYLFPERVDRLVLVSSGGLGRSVSPLLRAAALPGAELVLPLIASRWVRERLEGLGAAMGGLGWHPPADVKGGLAADSPRSATPTAAGPSSPPRERSSTPADRR